MRIMNFYLIKKFYILPVRDGIALKKIYEKNEKKKHIKRKKCYPLDESYEKN